MNTWTPWLADLDLSEVNTHWNRTLPMSRETGLMIVATLGVGFLAMVWALFVRKRQRGRPKRHHSNHDPAPVLGLAKPDADAAPKPGKKRRRRERRRQHRPRNPTLSQTGGLPPIRSDGPGDSVP